MQIARLALLTCDPQGGWQLLQSTRAKQLLLRAIHRALSAKRVMAGAAGNLLLYLFDIALFLSEGHVCLSFVISGCP